MISGVDDLRSWIGRTERGDAIITEVPLNGLAATVNDSRRFAQGDVVPPLWHWLFFLPQAPQAQLAQDGHPTKGGFLPPVPLPRRMWAGSRVQFKRPLQVGQRVQRETEIIGVDPKEGSDGPLVFVRLRHTTSCVDGVAILEEQDIVYRGESKARSGTGAPESKPLPATEFVEIITPSPTQLFRYSALTFNAHRIHYDRPYAQDVEGYPGLVVQGPFIATLLMNAASRAWPDRVVTHFDFKARRPIFDTNEFTVSGALLEDDRAELGAHVDGVLCTLATIGFDKETDHGR